MKCYLCNGKGGYEQLDRDGTDSTSWDICPCCNGTGEETDYKERYELQ